MDENEQVVVPQTTDEVEIEQVEVEETIDTYKARLAEETEKRTKAEEIAENQRRRAEKAERKGKESTTQQVESKLSTSDMLAIVKADIHEDDMDRVIKFSQSEGVSVKEALKNDELKAILAVRSENRATAMGANVSNVRRGSAQMSEQTLIDRASSGILPDSDDEINRLIAAKMKRK